MMSIVYDSGLPVRACTVVSVVIPIIVGNYGICWSRLSDYIKRQVFVI